MCLGLVMKVIKVQKNEAICDYFGNKTKVRIDFISNVKVNDYLLIWSACIGIVVLAYKKPILTITLFIAFVFMLLSVAFII